MGATANLRTGNDNLPASTSASLWLCPPLPPTVPSACYLQNSVWLCFLLLQPPMEESNLYIYKLELQFSPLSPVFERTEWDRKLQNIPKWPHFNADQRKITSKSYWGVIYINDYNSHFSQCEFCLVSDWPCIPEHNLPKIDEKYPVVAAKIGIKKFIDTMLVTLE